LHACARTVVECYGGQFPNNIDALRALPGVGVYTAAAVAAIAFDLSTVPVDGNVERVVSRVFAVEDELPAAKPTIEQLAASLLPPRRAGDFAQALMDLGATICSPKRPVCALCPWNGECAANARGDQETFPRKARKHEGRVRRGAAFVALRADGRVLLRRRPEKGLLASMMEVPNTEWMHDFQERPARDSAPLLRAEVQWRRLPGIVRHVFTHFPLELAVFIAEVPRATAAPKGARWVKIGHLRHEALPNLMRRVLTHALGRYKTAKIPDAATNITASARSNLSARLRYRAIATEKQPIACLLLRIVSALSRAGGAGSQSDERSVGNNRAGSNF